MISVVMPAYRESAGIATAVESVDRILRQEASAYEIIVIDDGSDDGTFAELRRIAPQYPVLRAVGLSRRFGKEGALLAGLRLARGRAVITMDSDLQHPPELIPEMLRAWRAGNSVINAVKRGRGSESRFQCWRSGVFNLLISRLGGIDLRGATDFKLLDRNALDTILDSFSEKLRFYRGLTRWIGFQQMDLPFDVAPRRAGTSAWNHSSLAGLAVNSIVSFSSAPLRLITYLGALMMIGGVAILCDTLWSWLNGHSTAGFPTIIFTDLISSASIMISLGIIGEYVAKIYEEVKGRPNYVIAQMCEGERSRQPSLGESTDKTRVR